MPKKILKFFISILIIALVFLIMFLNKENEDSTNENPSNVINENIETPKEVTEGIIIENTETEIIDSGVVSFTQEDTDKVDNAFTDFMQNEKYQTTIQNGDTLVYITFKNLGTVTFKMYDKTAPKAIEWFTSLANANKKIENFEYHNIDGFINWQFITTDRVYNLEEEVDEIYPMKYCLYQRLYSCNNFYISTSDYIENEIDSTNVSTEYIDYLKKYGGNFALYQNCIVLGRAVENKEILDKLDTNYEIEKIEVVKGDNFVSSTQKPE